MAIALLRNRHDAQGKVQVRTRYLSGLINGTILRRTRDLRATQPMPSAGCGRAFAVVTNLDGVMATMVEAIQAPSPARRGS